MSSLRMVVEKGKTFHMISGPSGDELIKQISDQTGLPQHMIDPKELSAVYNAPCKKRGNPLSQKYFSGKNKRHAAENYQQVKQRIEVFLDLPPYYFSYGLHYLNYVYALRVQRYENPGKADAPHKSLLLGALSPDSVHEYGIAVRDVYPGAVCDAIDIEGVTTPTAAPETVSFKHDNAVSTGYPDTAFDSVHTNHLLDMVKNPKRRLSSRRKNQQDLFNEVFRILRPKGIFLMVEQNVDVDILARLRAAGFARMGAAQAVEFTSRRKMEQFLRSTARDPLPEDLTLSNSILLAAQKLP